MRPEDEYRQLANSARKRAGDEESALMRAQWEILAGTSVHLSDQSAKNHQPKKIDDTGTYDDPIPWDRTLRKKALHRNQATSSMSRIRAKGG
jgi:hypothetical protein